MYARLTFFIIALAVFLQLTACGSERTSTTTTGSLAPTSTVTATAVPVPTDTPTNQSPSLDTETEPIGRQPARVVNIVDGDTIDVIINSQAYRVRYILMDTPERGRPYFDEATNANSELVANKTVYLEKDVSETDRYGRLLRYVYLEDGTFVNAEIVRRGYAQIATFPPDVSKEAEIRAAQQEARDAGRGLWGGELDDGEGSEDGDCDPSYPDVCIAPYPPDLDCGDITDRRFKVEGSDLHGFDGDDDGVGCESG